MSTVVATSPETRSPVDATAEPPKNRMGIALASLVGFFIALYLYLYELGVFGALLCGAGGCETVQASSYAVFLSLPVPLWGVLGYALLLGLALAGLQPRFVASRALAVAIFGSAAFAFAFSAYLTAIEAFVLNAWCRWCIGSAAAATLIFLFALAEIPRMRGR